MKMRGLAGLAILSAMALMGGGAGIGYVPAGEPCRGWSGFLGVSNGSFKRRSNRLRFAAVAKLKRRKRNV